MYAHENTQQDVTRLGGSKGESPLVRKGHWDGLHGGVCLC